MEHQSIGDREPHRDAMTATPHTYTHRVALPVRLEGDAKVALAERDQVAQFGVAHDADGLAALVLPLLRRLQLEPVHSTAR